MTFEKFLAEHPYVDYHHPIIDTLCRELFAGIEDDVSKAEAAYLFVRDKIPHSFDIESDRVPVKASEVLCEGTGICHAKANLLAALLRHEGIPAGFCYEHITLARDEKLGYCVHGFNAVYLGKWVKLDARGNKEGIQAEFSLDEFVPAFPPREGFDEYFYPGIYAEPLSDAMQMLEAANSRQDIIETITRDVLTAPDIAEED